MTNQIKKTIEVAKKAKSAVRFSLYEAFDGILIIVAISFTMGITTWIVKDTNINAASAGFWSLITLVVTSMFVIVHSRFKK